MTLTFEIEATDGEARTGRVVTSRGSFTTPCFMPVGTRGAVRHLSSTDLEDLGAEVVLANTYHLMLRPGVELVESLGGLHGFMAWPGHVLTDSGGYQVFSLSPEVDDDGVTFRSTYDGDLHRLTPEGAVERQVALGADLAMVLDVCPPWPAPRAEVEEAVDRTAAWAARARKAQDAIGPEHQTLLGIVQGGLEIDLRLRSVAETVDVGFDGYGIGGFSVGEPRDRMLDALEATTGALPVDRPRYLMGVGDPVGLVEAIARGIDLFDCVLPTRFARHGTILTATGRYNLRAAPHTADDRPLDPDCACPVCQRWSRAYLRHLLRVDEPTAPRLLTIHNVAWTLALVERARTAIRDGSLASLRSDIRGAWE